MTVAILALQFLDIATTYYLVKLKGYTEGNKLMKMAMDKVGFWPALLGIKGLFIALLVLFPTVLIVQQLILMLYLWVLGNNMYLILNKERH